MQFVWRADLYRALRDEAARRGVRIHHGKRMVDLRETADGVTARFADGTEAAAGILIRADGIRSTVRTLIDPGAHTPPVRRPAGVPARALPTPACPRTRGVTVHGLREAGPSALQVLDDGSGGWFSQPAATPGGDDRRAGAGRARGGVRCRTLLVGCSPTTEPLPWTLSAAS